MKKIFSMILVTIISVEIALAGTVLASADVFGAVLLNGERLQFDQPPFVENGRTLVPMRTVMEAMGAEVTWDETFHTVTATKDNITLVVQDYNRMITKNGLPVMLDVWPKVINDTMFAPVRAIAESFGAVVDWNGETNSIFITTSDDKIETDENVNILNGWTKVKADELDIDDWYDANWSGNAGYLYVSNDSVRLSLTPINYNKQYFDTPSGHICGSNYGEFGGSLEYFGEDGLMYTISSDINPVAIFSYKEDIYLLDGLAHLGMSSGRISRLVIKDGRYSIVDSVELGAAPEAYFYDEKNDSFLIVTNKSIIEATCSQNEIQVKILAEIPNMSGLYPSSIVRHENLIYVSMRRAVLTFNIETKEAFFYINKDIPTARIKN